MVDESTLDARRAKLAAAIRAARTRHEANADGGGVDDLLASVNDDLDRIAHEDYDEADRAYDRIQARLAAERIRIEDDEEEEDR